MRSLIKISQDIIELESVKKSYSHFLCTIAQTELYENVAMVEDNLAVIKVELRKLYTEMLEVKAMIAKTVKQDEPVKAEQPIWKTYKPTAQEEKAILAFNRNPQFTITE